MNSKNSYKVIGLMSGTSLDGLDIACCEFTHRKKWEFHLVSAQTYPYSPAWKNKLSKAHILSGSALMELHAAYGRLLGVMVLQFIRKHKVSGIDMLASHGHTVFHQPEKSFTFQLGDGASLHAVTDLRVVSDFRTLDVALGGEGAPLVPVGDRFLFPQYDVCLNLGGIANLSLEVRGHRNAFDVCFCNMALNFLTNQINKPFDREGKMAASGKVDESLLNALTRVYATYRKKRPSLAREMFERSIQPLLANGNISRADKLRTVCETVVQEIDDAIPRSGKKIKLLATGGGALNTFLISLLKEKMKKRAAVLLPPQPVIEFKEAIIFAFLGVLRSRNEVNVLRSVTQARKDSSSGFFLGM